MTDDEARANDLVHQHNEYVSDHVCTLACREAAIVSAFADARREARSELLRELETVTRRVHGEAEGLLRALATRRTT